MRYFEKAQKKISCAFFIAYIALPSINRQAVAPIRIVNRKSNKTTIWLEIHP